MQAKKDMKEIWKDCVGLEGICQVSNMGKVRTLPYRYAWRGSYKTNKGQVLKPYKSKNTYQQVDIRNKKYYVHRLIAETFVPNPQNLPFVNHKDENPTNNSADNLEWCTHQYNIRYSIEKVRRRNIEINGKHIYRIEIVSGKRFDYPYIGLVTKDGFNPKIVSAVCAGSYRGKIRNRYKNNLWFYAEI